MRILHVLAQLPELTGSGVYFSNVVRGLDENHTQGAIFGYQGDFKFDLVPEEYQYPVEFKNGDLNFPIVGMSDIMPYESTKYSDLDCDMIEAWQLSFRKRISKAIEDFKPDLILCHHLWMLTSMVVDLVDEDIRLVGACHGTDIRQCGRNPHLRRDYVKNIHKLDKIFALSEIHVPDIVAEYGIAEERVAVIGGGFNQDIFYRPESRPEKDTIDLVFAAKISQAKGVFQLVEAFLEVQKKNPDAYLHVIGCPSREAQEILDGIISPGDNVKVYNVKDQAALGDKFRECDIFILPSYFEGLGLVAIESLACDMRVVSTVIKGLQSLLGPEVEASGAIEYVDLPRLRNVDEPYEEDLDQFRSDLAEAINLQIERVRNGEEIHPKIKDMIDQYSWANIVKIIERELIETFES